MVLTAGGARLDQVYLNGAYVPLAQACVPVMDRGFLFGDGVYEVIPAYGGRPMRLAQHLERLDASLRGIRLENPLSRDAWEGVLGRLLAAGGAADQSLYLQVTRGAAPDRDHRFPAGVRPTVLAMARALKPRAAAVAESGVAAITRSDIRWHRCDIKSVTLLANVLLRQEAADAGCEEAILVRDGLVTEGSSSNLFLIADGRLVTPPKGEHLLSGITRDLVLELVRGAGIPCIECEVPREELDRADEIWITSSTREIMPVTRLDGAPVGDGRPGPLWRRADALYQDFKARLRGGEVG